MAGTDTHQYLDQRFPNFFSSGAQFGNRWFKPTSAFLKTMAHERGPQNYGYSDVVRTKRTVSYKHS